MFRIVCSNKKYFSIVDEKHAIRTGCSNHPHSTYLQLLSETGLIGTTIFRPPYVPVSLDAIVGSATYKNYKPTRLTPTHNWAEANGASFTESGLWLRAEWYSQKKEKNRTFPYF